MKISIFLEKTCVALLLLIGVVVVHAQNKEDLKLVTPEMFIEQVMNGYPVDYDNIRIETADGMVLSKEQYAQLPNPDELFEDRYIDKACVVRLVIVRKRTKADEALIETINKKMTTRNPLPDSNFELIDINCADLPSQLDSIRQLDQDIRTGEKAYDMTIDRSNLIYVVSAIEKCLNQSEAPLEAGSYNAIWLVLQHSPYPEYQEKYLDLLKTWAADGHLSSSRVALTEDRILMNRGEPQLYGSQIVKNRETGAWELYDLAAPEFVDYRRAQVGLGPLSEYVKRWDIEFTIEQKSK